MRIIYDGALHQFIPTESIRLVSEERKCWESRRLPPNGSDLDNGRNHRESNTKSSIKSKYEEKNTFRFTLENEIVVVARVAKMEFPRGIQPLKILRTWPRPKATNPHPTARNQFLGITILGPSTPKRVAVTSNVQGRQRRRAASLEWPAGPRSVRLNARRREHWLVLSCQHGHDGHQQIRLLGEPLSPSWRALTLRRARNSIFLVGPV